MGRWGSVAVKLRLWWSPRSFSPLLGLTWAPSPKSVHCSRGHDEETRVSEHSAAREANCTDVRVI
jgi:hypothetical protein